MDRLLQELEELTNSLYPRLMDTAYEDLVVFVGQRQEIIDALIIEAEACRLTPAQKDQISRIMEHDSAIMARMNGHRLEALDWLQRRNQAKAQRSAYEAAYIQDSILMDRKK